MAGAAYTDGVTTFDLTVGVIIDMDEAIYMLSPADSPFLTGLGADGLSVLSSRPTVAKEVSWMTDALLTPRSTLGAAVATAAITNITVATGDRAKFSTGDILCLGNQAEFVRVTGYAVTADVLLVSRAWSGAPVAVTHLIAAQIIGVGQALIEGSDPQDSRAQDRVAYTNICQIFGPTAIEMSETEIVVSKYGVPNEFARQTFLRTQELTIHREQAILYGVKHSSTDGGKLRTMAGMYSLITTNASTATSLTITSISAQQQICYNAGGQPDRLSANPTALTTLNDVNDTARVRQTFDDPKRGRVAVMSIFTEFGELSIARNRWMRTSDALLFSREQAVRRPLRPLSLEPLAKTGDRRQAQMVCEETLELKGQEHAAKFTVLA